MSIKREDIDNRKMDFSDIASIWAARADQPALEASNPHLATAFTSPRLQGASPRVRAYGKAPFTSTPITNGRKRPDGKRGEPKKPPTPP
jgi:hypothetical protein